VAEKYKFLHTFNKEKKLARNKWFYAFMRRKPQLSVRQPQATSLARAKDFIKDNTRILHVLNLFESNNAKIWFTPDKILNKDES
jgi:hypothetical protein